MASSNGNSARSRGWQSKNRTERVRAIHRHALLSRLPIGSRCRRGAASRILLLTYGRHHTVINSHPSVPAVVLTYRDLLDIVNAVSDARVYGGIHFRTDQDAAERQGKAIAQWNFDSHLRRR